MTISGQPTMSQKPLRALIIEHSSLDIELLQRELALSFDVRHGLAATLKDVEALLNDGDWDIILSDHNLPGWTGMQALALVQERKLDIPFILVTGALGEEQAIEYFRRGITDYVLKHRLELLPVAVTRALQETALRREKEHAELNHRKADERYRSIVENAPYGICLSAIAEDNFLSVNAAFARMLGYSCVSEVLQLSVSRDVYWHPEDRAAVIESLTSDSQFYGLDVHLKHKTGRPITVHASGRLIIDEISGRECFEAFVEDITETKRAQQALLQSEERYRVLFHEIPLPLWLYDVETLRFLAVNKAAIAHYGYSDAEFKAMTIKDIRPPEELSALLEDLAQQIEDRTGVWKHRKKDGTVISVDVTGHRLEFDGRRVGLVLANDVTEKIALESQLHHAQKMEALGRLAGGIAHDFNNLLMVINSYAQLLQARPSVDETSARYATQIVKAGQRATDVSRQLLLFSRKQLVAPAIVDLNSIVDDLAIMLRRLIGEDVEMVLALTKGIGLVKIDAGNMEQVIMNLVINARDAMPKGGKLTIESNSELLDDQHTRSHDADIPAGCYVCLSVADTGTGIAPEILSRIFDPFFTTKEVGKGTGLGLATAYGIVKGVGGFISVSSEIGAGTTFKIYLPRVDEIASPTRHVVKTDAPSGSETVLLVEDEAPLRSATREYLESKGYHILEASNGVSGLEVCSEYKDAIHVLITDVVMPRMGGMDLATKAIAIHPECKTICVSGYTDRSIDLKDLPSGSLVLQKPISLDSLAHSIRRILDDSKHNGVH
jgi:two-component system cell cycle sensor histidine kinase/response regulator CckA